MLHKTQQKAWYLWGIWYVLVGFRAINLLVGFMYLKTNQKAYLWGPGTVSVKAIRIFTNAHFNQYPQSQFFLKLNVRFLAKLGFEPVSNVYIKSDLDIFVLYNISFLCTKTPKGMLFGWFYVPKNQAKSIPLGVLGYFYTVHLKTQKNPLLQMPCRPSPGFAMARNAWQPHPVGLMTS